MAHERLGIAYEALFFVALRELLQKRRLEGTLHWNKRIAGLSIEPDLWIEHRGKPSLLLLIAHSDSKKNANMKFWRNICELAEIKIGSNSKTIVGSICCETEVAESLSKLERLSFDFYVDLPELDDDGEIRSATSIIAKSTSKAEDFANAFQTSLPKRLLSSISNSLHSAIIAARLQQKDASTTFWPVVKQRIESRTRVRIPPAKNTSVRRGISKLLVAAEPRQLIGAVTKATKALPSYLIRADFARSTIAGFRTTDPDIVSVVKLLGADRCGVICDKFAADPDIQELVQPLRYGYDTIETKAKYIVHNSTSLSEGSSLYSSLLTSHSDAERRRTTSKEIYYRPGWLLISIISLMKHATGRRQDYGYSKITGGLRRLHDTPLKQISQAAMASGVDGPWTLRAASTIEYGLRDWLFGSARTNFSLRPFELFAVAHLVAAEFLKIKEKITQAGVEEALLLELRDLLEFQVVTYRQIQPVKSLVEYSLDGAGYAYEEIQFFPTCVAERATANGERVSVRASATHVIKCRHTLIRWISVSDEGRDHKRKEFGARACLMPIAWDRKKERYRSRDGVEKLIILVDGTFRDSDLECFGRLGWDAIFYPDEMEMLVEAIV